MERRIAPPRDFEDVLDQLIDTGLFETKQKALMFAAGLGHHLKKRSPIDRRGVAIRYDIFTNVLDDGYINALAVADEQDLKLLANERVEEKITIFEEYAHSGLAEMKRRLLQPGDALDTLLKLAYDAVHSGGSEVAGIDPDVLRDLAL
jgi:dnd system-associated protein 4